MNVLVTGGVGFIGSHVVDQLIDAGHSVSIIDDLSTGRLENLNPKARLFHVDIRSPEVEIVIQKEKPEVISHHAAQMDVRRSVTDPVYDADVNIIGSLNLAQLAVKYEVRKFIHISSGGAVYGEPVYLPCDEQHPVQPLCPYGLTKYAFEKYLNIIQVSYGLDFSVLRYPNVYGPRQNPHGEAGVVAIFSGQMLYGKPVTINGTGEQVRDFVYVTDCARANLLLLENGSGQVYNLGSGVGNSVNDIFGILRDITQYEMKPIYAQAKVGETFRIYLDAQKAEKELGWKPTVTLREGLEHTVKYIQENEIG